MLQEVRLDSTFYSKDKTDDEELYSKADGGSQVEHLLKYLNQARESTTETEESYSSLTSKGKIEKNESYFNEFYQYIYHPAMFMFSKYGKILTY